MSTFTQRFNKININGLAFFPALLSNIVRLQYIFDYGKVDSHVIHNLKNYVCFTTNMGEFDIVRTSNSRKIKTNNDIKF